MGQSHTTVIQPQLPTLLRLRNPALGQPYKKVQTDDINIPNESIWNSEKCSTNPQEVRKEEYDKNIKMVDFNSNISILTLKVNGLYTSVKRQ